MANRRSDKLRGKYYLYLDGTSSRDLELRLLSSEGLVRRQVVRQGTRTEKMLPAVLNFVAKSGATPAGLAVVCQGGSFTQTRLVCAAANALAYAWSVPVVAVKAGASQAEVWSLFKSGLRRGLALPQYQGPGVG
ncbi:MAG: hypothetical protein HY974_00370 [Candidatus Kerfeldbacteria bacterium]|nr:hypothetical protein [Candidatus Kerfeldbacteria bacterium]